VREQVVGDFLIIPSHIIKSDEPIMIDGMTFEELRAKFDVPVWPLDTNDLLRFLADGSADPLSDSYDL